MGKTRGKRKKVYLIALFLFVIVTSLFGNTIVKGAKQSEIILHDTTEKIDLDSYIEILEDKSRLGRSKM